MLLFLLLLSCFASNGYASKFLIYNPKFGHSQTIFMNEISDILAKAGHDVLNYAPIVIDVFNQTAPKHARTLIRKGTHNFTTHHEDIRYYAWIIDPRTYATNTEMFAGLGQEFEASCKEQLNDQVLIEQLKSENFDLGLSEPFDICGFALFHKIGLKRWILLYSNPMPLADQHLFGIGATPSSTPSFVVSSYTERMSLKERFFNWCNYYYYHYYLRGIFVGQTAQAFDPNTPHYLDLMAQSQYVFINADEYMDFPRPISFKFVNIGGVGMKKLGTSGEISDPRIKKAIDSSKDGVVLVSFGSVASSFGMPDKNKQALLKAFAAFPKITFLWKYERPEDNISDGYPNIVTSTWFDQPAILSHPKLLAFMTHSGMNSLTQAVYAGAPMISIPLFADQTRNAALVESRKLGVRLDKFNLNAEVVTDAIRKVVYDKKYSNNAKELSRVIKSKPTSAEERILKYSEHAAQFDVHNYLDFYERQLNSIQQNGLDILAILIVTVTFVTYFTYRLCSKLFQLLAQRKEKLQ